MQRFGRNFECTVVAYSHHCTCVELPHSILLLIPAFDIVLLSVIVACMELQSRWEIAFFPRPKLCRRWPLIISGTVSPPQQQLVFLFFKTQVAFIYAYWYRVE